LFYVIEDPTKASYAVQDIHFSIQQLARSTMRAEVAKLTLEKTFEEQHNLSKAIVTSINHSVLDWGLRCLRFELANIHLRAAVLEAMDLQVTAERKKREKIIESEGFLQSEINVAKGKQVAIILESEARQKAIANINQGEADGILSRSKATAEALELLGRATTKN